MSDDIVLIICGLFVATVFILLPMGTINNELDNLIINITPMMFIVCPLFYSIYVRFGKKKE